MNKRILLKSSVLLFSLILLNFKLISAQSCNCPGNYILNPSFESGISNWNYANGNFSANTYAAQCGTYAGHFQHISGLGTFHQDITSLSVGTSLTLTFYGGVHDNSFKQKFGIQYINNLGNLISEAMVDVDGSLPNMSYYVINSIIPGGTVKVRIQGRTDGNWLKVDQLCLTGTSSCVNFTSLAQTDLNLVKTRTITNEISCSGAVDRVFYADCLLDNIAGGTSGNRKYWKIISGGTFKEFCDGTAYAEMQIQNVDLPTYKFDVTLILSGRTFTAPAGSPHLEGCTGSATSNWYYYTGLSGSFVGKEAMLGGVIAVKGKMAALQLGTNGSLHGITNNFGASSWLDYNVICQPNTFNYETSCQLDFNFFLSGGDLTSANASACGKLCVGQSTTLNGYAVGGKPNYTFTWSNGLGTGQSKTISPATTTTYTVTVTDANGCTSTDAVTVLVYPKPTVDVGVNQTVCAGKCADLKAQASGGTSPYTYEWNNGLGSGPNKNVCPTQTTTYSVTVTDSKGCTATNAVIVFVNPIINVSITKTDPKCGLTNGSATANATGGTSPYNYVWSNGATTQTINNLGSGTFSVTVTDSKNCTATKSVQLTLISGPIVNAGVDQSGCIGSSFNLSALATGGTPAYTYAWDNGLGNGQNKTVTPTTTTTYSITATDANGCTATDQVKVILYPNPSVTINKTDSKCGLSNGTATANASGGTPPYNFNWSTGATSQMISNLSSGTYSVTVTDSKGCKGTASTNINSNNGPTVNAGADQSGCIGSSFNLSALATGGTPAYTYAWDNGLGNGQNKSVTPNSTTIYTVTATDVNGCTATDQVKINIYPNPNVTINKTDAKCGLSNGTATANASGGTPPYNYNWSNGATTQMISNLNSGNYIVTVTDSKGCKGTASTVISNSDGPSINAGADQSGCIGSSFNLNSSASGGTPAYTYAWDNGLGNGQNKAVTPNATTTYTVTATDANGCSATDQVKIIVYPNPIVTINKSDAKCGLNNGTATANVTGGTSPYSYIWSNGATTQMISNLSSGNYIVSVTDAKGCKGTASTVISNNDGPSVNAGADQSGCIGSSFNLNSSASGGTPAYTYTWDNGLGNGQNKAVTPNATTTYTVTATDANGCSATDQVKIIVYPNPNVTINKSDAKCGLNNGTANANAAGGTSPYTYIWSNGATTQMISNLGSGNYIVTVTDAKGCKGTASSVINTNDGPTVNAGADQSGCIGSSFNLSSIASGGIPAYTYIWDNGLGNGQNKSVTPNSTTTYSITVTDANGCSATDQVKIIIYPNPSVTINKTDAKCGLTNGTANANVTGGTSPYSFIWSTGATTQMISNLAAGNYVVTVTDAKGCKGTASTIINNSNGPSVNAGADQSGCKGSTFTLSSIATGGTPAYTYVWDNGLGNGQNKTVTPVSTTTYTITVTDVNGCTATDQVKIIVNPNPSVSINKTDAKCGLTNGTATAIVTGGTFPYNYIWSNGATTQMISNLSSGNYFVTVTDSKGCTATAMSSVNKINGPTLDAGIDQDICIGNNTTTISALASGGATPYSYMWDNGLGSGQSKVINPIATTIYTVTVTDANSCTATDQVKISVKDCDPKITHEKNLLSVTNTGLNTYTVVYTILVKNTGYPGMYDLKDNALFDDDIATLNAFFTTNAPGNIGGVLNGNGPWSLADNQVISSNVSHLYTLTFNVKIDLSLTSSGNNIYYQCGKALNNKPSAYEALFNESQLDYNNDGRIDERDTACADLPFIVHEKNLVSQVQTGSRSFEVTYNIIVKNLGGASDKYTLTDKPDFDNDITITSANFSSNAMGNVGNPGPLSLSVVGPWTLANNQIIAAGGIQTYVIRVNVSINLEDASGDNRYDRCGKVNNTYPIAGEGLFNESRLDIKSDGSIDQRDTACGDIPYIVHQKSLHGGVTDLGNGNYRVEYKIDVRNLGGISGYYDLDDAPAFDDDIIILNATYSFASAKYGVYINTLSGKGPWALARNQKFDVGDNQFYIVTVNVKLDLSNQGPGNHILRDCGYQLGIPSSGEALFNKSLLSYNGVLVECDTACTSIPVCSMISGRVFFDVNTNGIFDYNENGINGLEVYLIDANSGIVITKKLTAVNPATPSDDGFYMFSCIKPGTYYVQFERPGFLASSIVFQGGNTDKDSDIGHENGINTTRLFHLTGGEKYLNIGAGFQNKATVGDYVWMDRNYNGLQDAGEEPVSGVQVRAYSKTTGNMVSEAISENDGHYMLDGIGQGDFYVKFIPPSNLSFTYAHSGTDPVDNDVDGSNGFGTTRVYRIRTGDAMPTIDAGLVYEVLPLEWLGFDGSWNGTFTELNWQTGIEINNDHFEIERKHESELGFKVIGQKKSSPNTSVSQQNYSYNDINVLQTGIYYYRLKQVDKDGRYTYSKVISIRIKRGTEMNVSIYPNPVDELLKVDIDISDESELEVRVFDKSGKNVLSNPFGGYRKAGHYQEQLNTSYLPSGQYNLQIISKNGVVNKTFTIQRN